MKEWRDELARQLHKGEAQEKAAKDWAIQRSMQQKLQEERAAATANEPKKLLLVP
jgi:hypothetical protein